MWGKQIYDIKCCRQSRINICRSVCAQGVINVVGNLLSVLSFCFERNRAILSFTYIFCPYLEKSIYFKPLKQSKSTTFKIIILGLRHVFYISTEASVENVMILKKSSRERSSTISNMPHFSCSNFVPYCKKAKRVMLVNYVGLWF